MLKGISVTFSIDPELFAKILAHAGKMTINTIETLEPDQPRLRGRNGGRLISGPKKKKAKRKPRVYGTKDKVRAYAAEHKQFMVLQAMKDLKLPRQQVYNAVSNLTHDKFIKRVDKGTYALVMADAA